VYPLAAEMAEMSGLFLFAGIGTVIVGRLGEKAG
jgi:hypothetical protein